MISPGTILQNKFRVLRTVQSGATGNVFEARHIHLDQKVAIKEAIATDDPIYEECFLREGRTLSRLSHKNLATVFDYEKNHEGMYLVMEWVDGNDLAELLKKQPGPLNVSTVIHWTKQILDVLEYLHSQNPPVIHLDIKPANIRVKNDGTIKLIDFGAAFNGLVYDLNSDYKSIVAYTPSYAPLEQQLKQNEEMAEFLAFYNRPKVDNLIRARTNQSYDIYALGATIYHLLTGKMPEKSIKRAQAVWRGENDPLIEARFHNSAITADLSTAIRRAMEIDQERRPATISELRAYFQPAFDRFFEEEITRTKKSSNQSAQSVDQTENKNYSSSNFCRFCGKRFHGKENYCSGCLMERPVNPASQKPGYTRNPDQGNQNNSAPPNSGYKWNIDSEIQNSNKNLPKIKDTTILGNSVDPFDNYVSPQPVLKKTLELEIIFNNQKVFRLAIEVQGDYIIGCHNPFQMGGIRPQISLPNYDLRVSDQHALIRLNEGKFYIMDLGTKLGTYFNIALGVPEVHKMMPNHFYELKDGMAIIIGNYVINVYEV